MLCSRSASLMSTTRMSSAMARNILRMFSACCSSWERALNLDSLVTPSTRCATSAPNRSSMSEMLCSVSSGTSWSSAAWTASGSSPISDRICATASGWVMYGSPDARRCGPCASRAKRYASPTLARSASGKRSRRSASMRCSAASRARSDASGAATRGTELSRLDRSARVARTWMDMSGQCTVAHRGSPDPSQPAGRVVAMRGRGDAGRARARRLHGVRRVEWLGRRRSVGSRVRGSLIRGCICAHPELVTRAKLVASRRGWVARAISECQRVRARRSTVTLPFDDDDRRRTPEGARPGQGAHPNTRHLGRDPSRRRTHLAGCQRRPATVPCPTREHGHRVQLSRASPRPS